MLRDLREQSEAYERESLERKWDAPRSTSFDMHLHGGLDLFDSQSGSCSDVRCRIGCAERVVRSVGLLADRVWMTDFLTEKFIHFGRVTNAKLDAVVADTLVLAKLWPLLAAGIVRFRSPWIPMCAHCKEHSEQEVAHIADELLPIFSDHISVRRRGEHSFVAETGDCFEPPVVFRIESSSTARPFSKEAYARSLMESEVRSALWVGREATILGGSIFSNSRVGLSGLLHQEGRLQSKGRLALLDRQRAIELPWVDELDAAQIVELRHEASHALPRFRERMATALRATGNAASTDAAADDMVAELREEAEELRAELRVAQAHSGRFWKTTYAILGLGVSAYGIGTDQILAGAGGLLPLVQMMIDHARGPRKDVATLKSRPGYVLVKAQDILRHSH